MDLSTLVSSVVSLFGGTVSVGGVQLDGLAQPERIPWGGSQRLVVHKLPGGGRVIDLMGQDDNDISWTGYLQGPNASYQARALDALRTGGQPVTLSWPGFTRRVIVSDFTCNSEWGGYVLSYSIKCVVVPTLPGAGAPSLLGQLANDIGNAIGVPNLLQTVTPVLATAQSALQTVQKVLPVVGVLTKGSPAFASVTSAVLSAQSTISTGLSFSQSAMGGVLSGSALTGTPLGTASPITAVANLQNALTQCTSMAGLSQMAGSVGRMFNNLTNAVA